MARGPVPSWVWAVLVGAHILALGWVLHKGSWDFPDSGRYLQAAENLRVYGELYAKPWLRMPPRGQAVQEFTIRPLGYPLAVLGLRAGMNRPVLLLGLQNLLSLLNIGLVLALWARWARPKASQWALAVVGVLSFPAQLIYANAVMSEMLLQTAVVVMVSVGLSFIRTQREQYFAGVAGASIIALLLKPVFYPLAFVIVGLGMWLAWRVRRINFAFIGLIPLVVVLLYMGWNKERTGYFHFSSIAEVNLLHYNAAGVVRQTEGPAAEEKWVASVLREANSQPDFAARQHVIQSRAGAVLWAHPVVYARQHLQGMAALFLDPGRFDVAQFLRLEPSNGAGLLAQAQTGGLWQALGRLPLAMLSLLGWVLLANVVRLVLAARGFLRLKHSEPGLRYGRWVALGLLLYVAFLTGPLGAARFLVPVWPLLFGLALMGLPKGPERDASGADKAAPVSKDQRQS
ncbi:hypothetical protein Q3A66_02740 [Hymenobacter sp. BT770]|uniref:hypothetical protein n=1 Tax=Hymenobacter sp. BT770 TaxID=2886942 RepID=UPI001D11DE87|nr:hypothetical protein [Hymenobacter sp. BT770]MCC3151452.1 hypothetical protein [Hymenobacter sp. BT770]MDO3413972.1 hypothetical protein [Hymenobacter sp. BT770]